MSTCAASPNGASIWRRRLRARRAFESEPCWRQNQGRPLRDPLRYEGLSRRVCRATRFRSALVCMQVLTTSPLPTRFRSALVCMQVLTTAPFPSVSESGAVCSVPQVWVLSLSTHAVILNRHVAIHSLGECSYAVWMSGSLVPVRCSALVRTRAVCCAGRTCAQKRDTS